MASQSYLIVREHSIIELIEAIKIEVRQEGFYNANPDNYSIWRSIKENAELLVSEIKAYVPNDKP